jgi:hexosaminidase
MSRTIEAVFYVNYFPRFLPIVTLQKLQDMRLTYSPMLLLSIMILLGSCQSPVSEKGQDARLAEGLYLEWELVSNQVADEPRCRILFQIRNEGPRALGDQGWALYYNQEARNIIPGSLSGNVSITRLGGDFFRLAPEQGFQLPPGGTVTIQADHGSWLIKEDQAPQGLYIVFSDEQGRERSRHVLQNYVIRPFTRPEQRNRFTFERIPDPTPGWQYEHNEKLTLLQRSALPPILPTPVSLSLSGGNAGIDGNSRIHYGEGLEAEADFLAGKLADLLGVSLERSAQGDGGKGIIHLALSGEAGTPESYQLEVTGDHGITIRGADAAGVFYGIQSLLALVPPEHYAETGPVMIPACTVMDAPRFPYRGMHLDVSRNFNRKEAVFRLLDVMAFYKLNRLHLHLTDDEGWRLQILQLPELTQVGAFRGHTLDEHDCLHPSYGSGPEPDPETGYGSGFFTQEDYVGILEYAHERHIQVIPEFDLPGHARAAIVAMKARYRRFMEEGDETKAREFLLSDPEDRSIYVSAQGYTDNVICVCQEASYRFIETVVDEVLAMYRKAGAPLTSIHFGGDEVPRGAWERSPVCSAFIKEKGITRVSSGLMDEFLSRTAGILGERDLVLSGWEEIMLDRHDSGYDVKAAGKQAGYRVYIWDNFTPGNQDIGYKIANAGYPIVVCSATNYYFELAYNRHPEEPGDFFGGFVDTYKAFEYIPFDLYKSIHANTMGLPYNPELDFRDMVKLQPGAEQNIRGLQGELWSEPIKGPEMLEFFYLPKMLGLAERAWSRQPVWATREDAAMREASLQEAWNTFANALGQRELPRLDRLYGGYHYRLPPPGLKVVDGTLHANTEFPGLGIRYTTDGSEPALDSEEYSAPVHVDGTVRARTFNTLGRGSRTVAF